MSAMGHATHFALDLHAGNFLGVDQNNVRYFHTQSASKDAYHILTIDPTGYRSQTSNRFNTVAEILSILGEMGKKFN